VSIIDIRPLSHSPVVFLSSVISNAGLVA